jgi:hypothetical protein
MGCNESKELYHFFVVAGYYGVDYTIMDIEKFLSIQYQIAVEILEIKTVGDLMNSIEYFFGNSVWMYCGNMVECDDEEYQCIKKVGVFWIQYSYWRDTVLKNAK